MILHEAYFGKTKDVLAIEKAVHDLRQPYVTGANSNFNINTYSLKIDADPNHAKLDNAIANAFGFSSVVTEILPTASLTFGTLASSSCIDLSSKKLKKSLRTTHTGFRYSESDRIAFFMMLPAGILVDSDFTDAEITAGILHEIGHNFSPAISRGVYAVSLFPALSLMSSLVSAMCTSAVKGNELSDQDILSTIYASVFISNFAKLGIGKNPTYAVAEKIDKECPAMKRLLGIGATVGGIAVNGYLAIKNLMDMINSNFFISYSNLPYNIMLNLAARIAKPVGYEDERFSDAFASMYGYSYELNSFLDKLGDYSSSVVDYGISKVPLLEAIQTVYYLPFDAVIDSINEHPTSPARAKNTIRYLEREIKSNKSISAADKKKMLQDIKDIDSIYTFHEEEMKKLPKGSDVKKMYNTVMYKLISGDFRHVVSGRHVSDDIDKAYAQTRESVDVYDTKERIGYIKETKDAQVKMFSNMLKNI